MPSHQGHAPWLRASRCCTCFWAVLHTELSMHLPCCGHRTQRSSSLRGTSCSRSGQLLQAQRAGEHQMGGGGTQEPGHLACWSKAILSPLAAHQVPRLRVAGRRKALKFASRSEEEAYVRQPPLPVATGDNSLSAH